MGKAQTEELTDKIIAESVKTIEMFGLTPLEARLFVLLYIEKRPMTLDEMSEALGRSKTAMSTSVRSLSDYNLVNLVWKKGERKDLYETNDQLYKNFMNNYVNKWIDMTSHQRESLEEISRTLNKQEEDSNTILNQQLAKIIDFHQQVERLFRSINDN
ncbi:GbsR/MarR family transcriptional regulator [Virgibacillus kekensis]|uniref:HTH-type transcriptional regulator n=1 Tax=Virgibacillus kekensis TaxID=202261 RepID=A0ABV9DK02_9BACI